MATTGNKGTVDKEVFSRPMIAMRHAVQTQPAQYIIEKSFVAMDRGLYYFAGHFLNQGMEVQRLETLEAEIIERFEQFNNEANTEMERLKAIMREAGVLKIPPMTYTKVLDAQIKVSNPLSRKFLSLVAKLDDLCRVIDGAWIIGAIDKNQRNNATFLYRNKLRKMAATTRSEVEQVRAALRKELNSAKAESEKKKDDKASVKANARKTQAKPLDYNSGKAEGVVRNADVKAKEETVAEAQ